MNILFLTSSTSENVFADLCDSASSKPNPSNQNFYHRLIKSLAMFNNVSVVSHRPCLKHSGQRTLETRYFDEEAQVKYSYTAVRSSKFYKLFNEKNEIINVAYKTILNWPVRDFVVIVDPLRPNLLKAALKIRKKFGVACIGMLTDNPHNLSKSNKYYSKKIISLTQQLDGYLSLSEGLLKAYGIKQKSHYIFEGIVEDIKDYRKEPLGKYFLFAGSLYERYGVKTMIEAFRQVDTNAKLLIMGSGPLKHYVDEQAKIDPRILYLSQVGKEKVYSLEQHALANINPRPFDNVLDAESIPSKMFEYLASGRPTLSIIHSRLYDIFPNDVYWAHDDSVNGLKNLIEFFLKQKTSDQDKKALQAKSKVYELFSLPVQGESITHFLTSFSTPNS